MFPWQEAPWIMIGQAMMYFFNYGDQRVIGAIGLLSTYWGSLLSLQRIYFMIVGMIQLNKQEKTLGFRFNDEMKKHHVTTTQYKSEDWYIDVRHNSYCTYAFIILRRDFINSLDKIIVTDNTGIGQGVRHSLIIRTIDGKKRKIYVIFSKHKGVILDFATWYGKLEKKGKPSAKGKPSRRNRIRNNR